MSSDARSVVIADDHPLTREGLRVILEETGWRVVADVGSADEALASVRAHRPDVCVVGLTLPGGGVDACQRITEEMPGVAVVVLTSSADVTDLFDALRAGARGYLLKDIAPERLAAALEAVLQGEAALSRSLTARLMEEFRLRDTRPASPARLLPGARLTPKEWEVLVLMRDGQSTTQISEVLSVQPVTVRTHISSILRKLDVGSRAEAVAILDDGD